MHIVRLVCCLKVLQLGDRDGVCHPEERLGGGHQIHRLLALHPVQELHQRVPLLATQSKLLAQETPVTDLLLCGEPVGVEGEGVGGAVGGVVAGEVLLQPGQDVLAVHVGEDALVQVRAVTARITLHTRSLHWKDVICSIVTFITLHCTVHRLYLS